MLLKFLDGHLHSLPPDTEQSPESTTFLLTTLKTLSSGVQIGGKAMDERDAATCSALVLVLHCLSSVGLSSAAGRVQCIECTETTVGEPFLFFLSATGRVLLTLECLLSSPGLDGWDQQGAALFHRRGRVGRAGSSESAEALLRSPPRDRLLRSDGRSGSHAGMWRPDFAPRDVSDRRHEHQCVCPISLCATGL